MKGNVKKIFAAVLALALVVSVAGCGENKTGLDADGNYEVVWYNSESPQPDHQLVYEKLSEYTKEKIGVTIKYTPFAGAEYGEKMNLLFAAGEKIDMCFASTGTKFQQNARNAAYMDIGKLLDTVGEPTKNLFPEYALDCFKVGGVQYGIPTLKDWGIHPSINALKYKLEDLDIKEEFLAVDSLEGLTPLMEKAKAANPDWYGILVRGNHNLFKFLPLETVDGSIIAGFTHDNYDKVVNLMETDTAKDFFKLVRSWYKAGYIRNDAATVTSDSDVQKIGNFMFPHGEWLPYYGITVDESDPNKPYYALNLCDSRMPTSQLTSSGLAMPRTCVNPERTMEFINLLYNDAYVRNTIAYGIENKHWVADGETHVALPEGYAAQKDTGYASSIWTCGNRFLLRISPGNPADIWEKYQEFNEECIKAPSIGFTFDPAPVAGQIAAVQNVYSEFFPSLVTGSIDVDTKLPEFIDKMNKVGAKDIVAEVQRQYDEWKKTK